MVKNNNMISICPLLEYGVIRVSGTEASKLLQGQLTCDVNKIIPGECQLGAHCNPQGRIISLFRLIQIKSIYYLILPRMMVSLAMSALKKYAPFFKAELTDASNDFMMIGCLGSSNEVMQSKPDMLITIAPDRHIIFGEVESVKSLLKQFTLQPLSVTQAWKYFDIKTGIPNIYPETSGKFLPQEINLPKLGAVNFEKGCYTGQEIIARMHYRGKLKTHMHGAKIATTSVISPGTDIYSREAGEERVCGVVVDSTIEEYNHFISLIVADEKSSQNNALFLKEDAQALFTLLDKE